MKNKKNKGSVYIYTMFFVIAMFSMIMLLLRVSLNNAVPTFTNVSNVNLYHAARSGIDLFLYRLQKDYSLTQFNNDFNYNYRVQVQLQSNRIISIATGHGFSIVTLHGDLYKNQVTIIYTNKY